jgi:aminopeptidase N
VGAAGAIALAAGTVACSDAEPDAAASTTTTTAPPTTTSAAPVPEGTPGQPGVGDPYYPSLGNGGYDVDHYTLELTWQADAGVLEGVTTIEAAATQDLSRFNLDLAGMDVRAVTVDGEDAGVSRTDRELVVTPSDTLPEGASFSVVVSYRGRPAPLQEGTDLFALGWQTDGREAYVVSEPSGASTFFPVNDHPTDKASYTLRITAPEDQTVAANGLLTSHDDVGHGMGTWTYEAPDQMASYLVQVAIGDYELVDAGEVQGVPIRHALHRGLLDRASPTVANTPRMLEVLSEVFGPYPFSAYGLVAVDEPLGFALETQTLTIIGADLVGRGAETDPVLVHELAHQWVGDAVSPATWQDIWLNEGFATYAELLYAERTGGPSAADLARRFEGAPELDAPPGDPGAEELFAPTVYRRGGMTLQALRERIGDPAFFEVLRTWVADHDDATASTADFIALSETVSGEQLDELFDAWLFATDAPRL